MVLAAISFSPTIRYNPENIKTLEHYVDLQSREKGNSLFVWTNQMSKLSVVTPTSKGYDLEANLALLKLYQFNPTHSDMKDEKKYRVVSQVLSKVIILHLLAELIRSNFTL